MGSEGRVFCHPAAGSHAADAAWSSSSASKRAARRASLSAAAAAARLSASSALCNAAESAAAVESCAAGGSPPSRGVACVRAVRAASWARISSIAACVSRRAASAASMRLSGPASAGVDTSTLGCFCSTSCSSSCIKAACFAATSSCSSAETWTRAAEAKQRCHQQGQLQVLGTGN